MNASIDSRPLASYYSAINGAEVCQLRGVEVLVHAASRSWTRLQEGHVPSLGPETQAPAWGHLVLLPLVASSTSGQVFCSVLFSLFC